MKRQRTDRILLGMSIGSFLAMSVSFLLMPMESAGILPGLLFWTGLAFGVLLQIVLEMRRRAFFRAYAVPRKSMQKPHNGAFTFGSNRAAAVADSALVACLAATVVVLFLTKGYGYGCYVLIAATVFSVCMHCILNGRIFFHAKNQHKVRQALEQKKANSTEKGAGET